MIVIKNSTYVFCYVFPSSMTVESFITIMWQEKKLSMIKVFKSFFVSGHLKEPKTAAALTEILKKCGRTLVTYVN